MTELELLDFINTPEEPIGTVFNEKLKTGYRIAQRKAEILTAGLSYIDSEISTSFDEDNHKINYEIKLVDKRPMDHIFMTVNKQ